MKILLALLFFIPALSVADDMPPRPVALRDVPAGIDIEHEGRALRCYTLDGHKALAHIIIDYRDLFSYAAYMEAREKSILHELTFETKRVELWKTSAESEKRRGDYLQVLLDGEVNRRLKAEKQNQVLIIVPWSITAGTTIVYVVVSIWAASEVAGAVR